MGGWYLLVYSYSSNQLKIKTLRTYLLTYLPTYLLTRLLTYLLNLLSGYFYHSSFTSKFLNRIFLRILFVAGERKINKIYQRQLKLHNRLWAFSQFYRH